MKALEFFFVSLQFPSSVAVCKSPTLMMEFSGKKEIGVYFGFDVCVGAHGLTDRQGEWRWSRSLVKRREEGCKRKV